jgi:hypothetical protein
MVLKIKAIVLLLLLLLEEEDNDSYMSVGGCTLAWRRLERLPAGTDAERRR